MFNSISVKLAFFFLLLVAVIALFASILANTDNGLLVKYGPNTIGEKNNTFEPPGFVDTYNDIDRVHPLGTDGRGRDVASILIHGSRTSILLGFFASLISILFGTSLGLASAYYGNNSLVIHPFQIILFVIGTILICFYAYEWSWARSDQKLYFNNLLFILSVILGLFFLITLLRLLSRSLKGIIAFPMDSIVMRFTEIFRAVPKLFLLLFLITFLKSQGLWTTTLLLGALGWSRILRLVRGEVLEIKQQTYVINAKIMGLSDFRIILKHILPNVMPLILVSMAFLISGNILMESTLSFLGLGLPLDLPSWGGLLRQSREDFGAWWLAVFPGFTITFTLFSLNILAEHYNKLSKKAF